MNEILVSRHARCQRRLGFLAEATLVVYLKEVGSTKEGEVGTLLAPPMR